MFGNFWRIFSSFFQFSRREKRETKERERDARASLTNHTLSLRVCVCVSLFSTHRYARIFNQIRAL